MNIFLFDLKREFSIPFSILLLCFCDCLYAKNVKVFRNGDVYVLDETQFQNPEVLNFDDDYDKEADQDDLYDEKVSVLPPYVVWRFGQYSGYDRVPITTRKVPTWATKGSTKPLVTWTTPEYTPITRAPPTSRPIQEARKVKVNQEWEHIFVPVTTPTSVDTTTKKPGRILEFTPQPKSMASNFPAFNIPWSIWSGSSQEPEVEATTRRSVQDSDSGRETQKSAPAWVPWWKTSPSSSHRVTTPTGPRTYNLTTPQPEIFRTSRPNINIPIATRAQLNFESNREEFKKNINEPERNFNQNNKNSHEAIQENVKPKDAAHEIFEFGPQTTKPVPILPQGGQHLEQHVMSNTIFLKLKGGQVFNARIEATTETPHASIEKSEEKSHEPQPEIPRPQSRPFFRPIEESQTVSRIGSTAVKANPETHRGSNSWPGQEIRGRNRNPAPKPVIIRHGNQHFHGPTFKCRILNPIEDGRPSPSTDETCNLIYPGFSADGSCRCTYVVEDRDSEGCATGFLYICRRIIPVVPEAISEEFKH
uniref:Uncharacterized protein n=1 Tax=Acrobeloides nanus TaxID=290746 RepID=A0A914C4A5_9BILA